MPSDPAPVPRGQGGMLPAGAGAHSPFASSQVDFGGNVAPSSANSLRVVTIVFGLLFMVGAAVAGALAVLAVSLIGLELRERDAIADAGKGKGHVRDTGLVEEVDLEKVKQRRRIAQDAVAEAERDPMKEMFGGLGAAPITVTTHGPGRDVYRQIEVICRQVNFRDRAPLVNDRAHIAIVPAARCDLVFQGNVPMRHWITGGDTLKCSFDPLICKKQ